MTESVFVVTKQGVYRHDIMGIFTVRGDAFRAAKKVLKAEHDNYHNFHVTEIPLNAVAGLDESGMVDEGELLRIYKKDDKELWWYLPKDIDAERNITKRTII
jgi:hypothetical protein